MSSILIQREPNCTRNDKIDHSASLEEGVELVILHEYHFEARIILHVDHGAENKQISFGEMSCNIRAQVQEDIISCVDVNQ